MGVQPLRQAPLPALLHVLHREGVGRARAPSCAPSGPPSASRACRSSRPPRPRSSATDNKIKSLINEFNYPRFGPGQMWETMTDEIIENGGEVRMNTPVTSSRSATASSSRSRPAASASSRRRHLVAAAAHHGRPGRRGRARRGPGRRAGPALPRLPDGLADHRRRGSVPGQLDLHPRARRRGRPHPELPLLVAVDGPGPVQGLDRHGVLLLQGRRALGVLDEDLVALATRELEQLGLAKAAKVERGFVVRVPKATRCTTRTTPSASTSSRLARGISQPPAGRP